MNSVNQMREAEVAREQEMVWVCPSVTGELVPAVPEDEERWDGLS